MTVVNPWETIVQHFCPDCDQPLDELTRNEMLSQASRYLCTCCGTRWVWAPVGMLVEDQD